MPDFVWFIAFLVVAVIGLVIFLLRKPSQANGSLGLMQQEIANLRSETCQSITDMRQELSNRLKETHQTVGDRLDSATRVVGDIKGKLGELEKASERIFDVGKDIAGLEQILRVPKLRGGLGELLLGNLLAQILPQKNYTLQYEFKSGQRVDAVIRLGNRLVPVDAKFPLENFKRLIQVPEVEKTPIRKHFNRDVKKHIDDIANKYILTDEETYDFALMYIPAENVYYEIILKDESGSDETTLNEYAVGKKVFPVSPNSFYAYLQVIVLGLKGMRIEQNAQELLAQLLKMRADFTRFRGEFEAIGNALNSSQKHFTQAERKLNKIDDKFTSIETLPAEQ